MSNALLIVDLKFLTIRSIIVYTYKWDNVLGEKMAYMQAFSNMEPVDK